MSHYIILFSPCQHRTNLHSSHLQTLFICCCSKLDRIHFYNLKIGALVAYMALQGTSSDLNAQGNSKIQFSNLLRWRLQRAGVKKKRFEDTPQRAVPSAGTLRSQLEVFLDRNKLLIPKSYAFLCTCYSCYQLPRLSLMISFNSAYFKNRNRHKSLIAENDISSIQ